MPFPKTLLPTPLLAGTDNGKDDLIQRIMLHVLGMCSNSHPKEAEEERELKVERPTLLLFLMEMMINRNK